MKFTAKWGVDTPQIAKEVYDWAAPCWSTEVSVPGIQKLLKQTADRFDQPQQPIESFLDLRFLDEAQALP